MALRTRAEWEAIYDAAAPGNNFSTSTTAEWLAYRNQSITLAMQQEARSEMLKTDVDNALLTKQVGTIGWYPGMIKQFQKDYNLDVVNGVVGYDVVDAAAQIVKHVSVREDEDGRIRVKVSKDDGNGEDIAFDNTELDQLKVYLKARAGSGRKRTVTSRTADSVKYTIAGLFDVNYVKANVVAALQAALVLFDESFGFDALLYHSEMFQVLKAVPGMRSLQLVLDITMSDGTVVNDMDTYVELVAGYFNYDNTSTITLEPAP